MYDFNTRYSRANLGSSKWDVVKRAGYPETIVPLSVADMEFPSAPEIIKALEETARFGMWGYSYGGDALKEAVAGWMKRRHRWAVKHDWIVNTSGVVPAVFSAVRAFTKPGDKIIVQPPVYYPFYSAIEKNQRTVSENQLVIKNGRYEMDLDDLEQKAREASMMILCSPHNPVGRVWTREELTAVAEICCRNQVLVFADEIHFDLVYPPHQTTAYGTLKPDYVQNAVIGTAASKTFSLAGLGCSSIIIPNEDLRIRFEADIECTGTHFNSIFGAAGTIAAYEKGEPWLNELLDYLAGNYQYLKQFMAEHFPKVTVYDMEGTYLAWLDCSSFGLSTVELEQFMQQEAQLFLDEGYIFGHGGEGFERINLACPRSVLKESLERLQNAAIRKGIL